MPEEGKPPPNPESAGNGERELLPVLPTVFLFLLVGALVWAVGDGPSPRAVTIQNPADEARFADVVWRHPGGTVSGSLLRVIEPSGALSLRIPRATVGCVRWIEGGTVQAAWPAGSPSRAGASVAVLEPPPPRHATPKACPPELLEHRIRPALGRWMQPGEPARVYRERMIPRILHRRAQRRGDRIPWVRDRAFERDRRESR